MDSGKPFVVVVFWRLNPNTRSKIRKLPGSIGETAAVLSVIVEYIVCVIIVDLASRQLDDASKTLRKEEGGRGQRGAGQQDKRPGGGSTSAVWKWQRSPLELDPG